MDLARTDSVVDSMTWEHLSSSTALQSSTASEINDNSVLWCKRVCSRGFHTAWTDTDRILYNSEHTEGKLFVDRDQDICINVSSRCTSSSPAPNLLHECIQQYSQDVLPYAHRDPDFTSLRMIFCLGIADSLYFGNGSRELTLLQRGNIGTSRLMSFPSQNILTYPEYRWDKCINLNDDVQKQHN